MKGLAGIGKSMRKFASSPWGLILGVSVGLLAGCGSQPRHAAVGVEPPTFSIAAGGSQHGVLDADSSGERARRGAATGGVSGAGAGAALGLGCGFLAYACVPAFAAVGLVAGSTGGAFYGLTGLPKDQAKRVNAVLDSIEERRHFRDELREALAERVPAERQDRTGSADIRVDVAIKGLEMRQHLRDRLSMELQTTMQLRGARKQRLTFRVSTDKKPIERWLADGGRAFEEELTRCIAETAERMHAALLESAVGIRPDVHVRSLRQPDKAGDTEV